MASARRWRLAFILLVSSELIVGARKGLAILIGYLGANGTYDAMFAVGADGGLPGLRGRPSVIRYSRKGCSYGGE